MNSSRHSRPSSFLKFCLLMLISASFSLPAGETPKTTVRNNSFVAMPYVFYTPETGLAGGAGALYTFRMADKQAEARPSNVKLSGTYTQKNQVLVVLWPELYFANEKYFFEAILNYFKYPDRFYGLGNTAGGDFENFTPQTYRAWLNFQMRLRPALYGGLKLQYDNVRILAFDDPEGEPSAPFLRDGEIPGSRPFTATGLGIILKYDTRDNLSYPHSGQYHQLGAIFYDEALGSNFAFNSYFVDMRRYFSFLGDKVLAVQALCSLQTGAEIPFQLLAPVGGQYVMRGYYFGRFRDKALLAFQGELRLPVWWRFKLIGYLGAGDVAPAIDKFQPGKFKQSFGFGLRYLYNPEERIHIRLDFAFLGGEVGPYVNVIEAF